MGKIGIVFDMDGVLFLTSDLHYDAFCQTLADESLDVPPYRVFAGMRTDMAFRRIFDIAGVELSEHKLADLTIQKRACANRMLLNNPPIAPNCNLVLKELYSRGFTLALASSASRKNVEVFLESSKTRAFFTSALSGDDVNQAKPDPEIFEKASMAIGIEAQNCFVVEDSIDGALAAQSAGMSVIGMLGLNNLQDFSAIGVTNVVSELIELLEMNYFKVRI